MAAAAWGRAAGTSGTGNRGRVTRRPTLRSWCARVVSIDDQPDPAVVTRSIEDPGSSYAKTIVLGASTITRSSTCQVTAWASTCRST